MFLISSNDQEVIKIVEDLDNLRNFTHLDLGELNTLELTELVPKSVDWVLGEPLIFDDSSGVVLLPYSIESLEWFSSQIDKIESYGVASESVRAFCSSGITHLYCLDTF